MRASLVAQVVGAPWCSLRPRLLVQFPHRPVSCALYSQTENNGLTWSWAAISYHDQPVASVRAAGEGYH